MRDKKKTHDSIRVQHEQVHQKDTISHILWYSDWQHNTTSAENSIFYNQSQYSTSGGRSIM